MNKQVDFLVIGSGLAGLLFALKASAFGKVCIVTKSNIDEGNTRYAQGGIASVTYEPDNYQKHIEDTVSCGDGLCDNEVVKMVVEDAPKCIAELIELGTNFDKTNKGTYDLAREGGHTEHRILHYKDKTGLEIERALVEQVRNNSNIEVLEHHFAIDIITQHHLGYIVTRQQQDVTCFGAYVLNTKDKKIYTFLSKVTFMATGGIGNIYQTTTNPLVATGDGISMVYRAKGAVDNMEFVQFHPTSFYNPGERPSFLITEAMRGFGAILRLPDGSEFMQKYDQRQSLAPRDIVARAIDNEMKINAYDFVYLDATHLDKQGLLSHFPTIYEKCKQFGVDITKDMIPVVPAAHYLCGGIKVDILGRTTINRLYAAGECTSTGLHGANRLASNSLLEAAVYANRAIEHAKTEFKQYSINTFIPPWNDEGTTHPEEMILITQEFKELQGIMTNYVGIVRSNLRLNRALDRLETLYRETEVLYNKSKVSVKICELRNAINIGYLIIKMAKRRKESRGLHYMIDHLQRKELKPMY